MCIRDRFEREADCDRVRRDCRVLVDRIHTAHGADCLVWKELPEVRIADRLALLSVADVFWVSSVRDGLNRWPLEYVAMQYETLMGSDVASGAATTTTKTGGGAAVDAVQKLSLIHI